ncbi:MAG: SWIM zinc finger domain-containing protein [Microcoleus sp. PH2017_39_LGB_O_B]|uniref:SWIM zinc finger family protein n=1 Tax=unclassified Microcoleus TaxID=2642155 RepID=UPI001D7CF63B|nr:MULTISPECIES: SWIM zinc finger domain-containing protein [unclassified Microcoleus]MCC3448315.1 SWIM zinc finger domain-containing protein [Microcoleus sp. PH2017_09_SFU_O_A]MCC3629308.1 SWIM zinc finger domain-containing protein [Microcoleus sp. PH2017_39_LGB_O_B]MCC3641380.1 SWIM zinc finger domain-containing protein [Microcoleus sp. PH2017_33_LGB_O_A]TAF88114.1 MAG: SWIM zinc finger domain-containing protein [Oscillatoriales cyanobacterium]
MPIPKLSETIIKNNSSERSLNRAEDYYLGGNVASAVLRGNMVQAKVYGSQVEPYDVTLPFTHAGLTSGVFCTCPYDGDGWCKHIIATLFLCLREPEKIERGETLEELLSRLNDAQIYELVEHLVDNEPSLISAIELYVNSNAVSGPTNQLATTHRRSAIDPAPFRRQVREIFRQAQNHWEDEYAYDEEDPITEEILELIQQAQEFSEHGDGKNALVILEAITSGCVDDWDDVAEYGCESYEITNALDEAWTEAILTAELTAEEEIDFEVMLEGWKDEWDCDFSMSLEALRQGWDYPPLQQILEGNLTGQGIWDVDAPDYAHDLTLTRLQILDRQNRDKEYLYLAKAEGCIQQYLTMLARLGRIEEAVKAAATDMTSVEEAFALVQTLQEDGNSEEALKVCQLGLNLPGNSTYKLAVCMSELADELGEKEAAFKAKMKVFEIQPSLNDYLSLQELSGDNLSTLKADLLAILRATQSYNSTEAKVDIFLHEKLIEEAIALVDTSYGSQLVHRVMMAAIPHRPDWVIVNASRRAESILNQMKSAEYDSAIEWLEKARAAYIQTGRNVEWSAYRAQLMEVHSRKRKFMGLFKNSYLN